MILVNKQKMQKEADFDNWPPCYVIGQYPY